MLTLLHEGWAIDSQLWDFYAAEINLFVSDAIKCRREAPRHSVSLKILLSLKIA